MGDFMSKQNSVDVLLFVADFLKGLSDSEINDLLSGQVELTMTPVNAEKKRRKAEAMSDAEIQEVLDRLYLASTRDAGFKILEEHNQARKNLEAIARYADFPVRRRDKVSDLKERIVESTIGYRLRSQAILGNTNQSIS